MVFVLRTQKVLPGHRTHLTRFRWSVCFCSVPQGDKRAERLSRNTGPSTVSFKPTKQPPGLGDWECVTTQAGNTEQRELPSGTCGASNTSSTGSTRPPAMSFPAPMFSEIPVTGRDGCTATLSRPLTRSSSARRSVKGPAHSPSQYPKAGRCSDMRTQQTGAAHQRG